MEIKNAIIEKVSLGFEDHGILTAFLHLSYGGSSQGFGGYALYLEKNTKNYCGFFITRVLETVGVSEWKDLVGKTIRVKSDMTHVEGIGHIIENRWFYPKQELKMLEAESNENA